nr:hypothetical protein BaRGS_028586 [Batillaria attramentaria]
MSVEGVACYQCPFNVSDCYRPHCVAAGGNIRALLTINRQMPGPAIQVCEGDTVVVAVTNMLEDGLSTSIHWHGQHMHGTPYMDGMGQVTQCQIQHMETFTYKFKADPAGSHWYQRSHRDAVRGRAFSERSSCASPPNYDPNDNLYDLDLPEHVIIVNDWLSELSMARYVTMMHKIYELTQPTATCWSTGRGRNYNVTGSDGAHAQTPLDVLHVQKGKKYRMRLISTAPACPMQVSVDDHQLMVISVDEETGAAILRYEGAPEVDPSGDRTQQRDGILLNPILFDGNITKYGWNREVIRTDDMRYAYDSNYTDEVVDFKYFLGLDLNFNSKYNNKELYPAANDKTTVINNVGKSLSRSNLEQMDARGELRRNYIKPPVRDTVNVPDGGYAIIRFTATNPGMTAGMT